MFKPSFPQSNFQDIFSQSLNEQFFFYKMTKNSYLVFSPFALKMTGSSRQKSSPFLMLLCTTTSRATGCISLDITQQVLNFEEFWSENHWVSLLSSEKKMAEKSNYCTGRWLLVRFLLIYKTSEKTSSTKVSVDNFFGVWSQRIINSERSSLNLLLKYWTWQKHDL